MLAAACVLSACSSLPTWGPGSAREPTAAPAGTVSVTTGDPAQFSEAREGRRESDKARRAWLDALSEHLAERAAVALPPGQKLEVLLTDVKRAGGFEPWRGPQSADLRIVRDIYPPRIDLDFKRMGPDGSVLQSGSRQLRDLNFMARPRANSSDPLAFEKALIDDWVAKEFAGRR